MCLALGIGANAATYSLFEEMLLRPLPVREPERLVNFDSPGPRHGRDNWNQTGPSEALFSYPMFRDLANARPALVQIVGHRMFFANFAYHGATDFGMGTLVSGSYFAVLGLRPAVGRLLGPADDRAPDGSRVAVLSHGYWTTELGGDSSVVGKTMLATGRPLNVVGVAPRGFEGTTRGVRPRMFAPFSPSWMRRCTHR